ncbi:hypothetical protein F0310_05530 (plasmid) [Borrelia sp. A-FGy1]|uniref:OspD family protein n=1 Tax=Borrelia sp. A-FGy1 TaxID=2608247 RepID=UPI0015F7705E|nr:OspD family protein [Borrelia sp. A-FGy1]QMU99871.1 hypothetical protein F0310_05530 [Borrelia sp. A-FGy1]
MKKIIKVLFLLLASCVHEQQKVSSIDDLNDQKGYLDNQSVVSESYESKKKSLLNSLNQSLIQTTDLMEKADLTVDNLNESDESNKVVEVVISGVNLISASADQLKSLSESIYDLAQTAGIDLEEINKFRDKATVASNVARQAYDLTKSVDEDMKKLYEEQQKGIDLDLDSASEEIKQARINVDRAWEVTIKAKDHLIDLRGATKEVLDKVNAEITNNKKLEDIKRVVELAVQVAENAKETAQKVITSLNT